MKIVCQGNFVITGGAGAIAGHVAHAFTEAGARLALVEVDAERLKGRTRELGALAITAAGATPDNAQQVKRLQELKAPWVEVRDGMKRIGTQEMDPEVIRREMENLKQLTGGEDAFDIVETMSDLWQALDKWVVR